MSYRYTKEKTNETHQTAQKVFKVTIAFIIMVFIFWGLCLAEILGTFLKEFAIFIPLISAMILICLFNAFESRAKKCFDTWRKKRFLKIQIVLMIFVALGSALI